jgi:hypothetical protein
LSAPGVTPGFNGIFFRHVAVCTRCTATKNLPLETHFIDAPTMIENKQHHSLKHIPYLSMKWIGSPNERDELLMVAQV